MCGRFTLTVELSEIQQDFGATIDGEVNAWVPRYNIAPTQQILTIQNPLNRIIQPMRWGLIPFWAKNEDIGNQLINARSESLAEKPSFRRSLQNKRCLILADGFYEWKTEEGKGKTPYYFRLKDQRVFTFAGLWDEWSDKEGNTVLSCTIITCNANEFVASFHQRMPVILDKDHCWEWLEDEAPRNFRSILVPYPSEEMEAYPVDRAVNDPKRDHPDLIRPI